MDLYPHHWATWSRQKLEAAIRRRVQTAYLGDGIVLARILGRHKIFLRSPDRGDVGFPELRQSCLEISTPGLRAGPQ
jgi:hypothetical protein